MHKTESHIYTAETWFVAEKEEDQTTGRFIFFGDVSNAINPEVEVASGTHIVTFNLRTAINPGGVGIDSFKAAEVFSPASRANFSTNPIQWVNEDDIPYETPAVFSVGRVSGVKTNIFVCNSKEINSAPESYKMRIIVMFEGGIFWTPDPTMVNLPANP